METLDEVLAHHGVKGMRWGVRRSSSSSSSSSSKSGHISEDAKKAQESHSKVKSSGGTHVLSNQDLQHLVNRMNLEQQFSKLSSQKQNAGARFAKDVIVNVGKQQVTSLISNAVTKGLKK